MIKRINIREFGCFSNFDWGTCVCVDSEIDFGRLNILYGRNYSGKTTLSRILRSLQEHRLPDHYEECSFVIETDDGRLDEKSITSHDLDIRVYNRDFVGDHLSFLTDDEGNIEPFAIVGSENQAIEARRSEIAASLGSEDAGTGKRHAHSQAIGSAAGKRRAADAAHSTLKAKLTEKATQPPNGIKHNPLYKDPNYNTPKIEADIATNKRQSTKIMDAGVRSEKVSLLQEDPLADISLRVTFHPKLAELHRAASVLLTREIAPTKPLQDLLNDAVLQAWVKAGIPLHRATRKTCGFCGGQLPETLWQELDAHFNKESEQLDEELARLIDRIDAEKGAANSLDTLDAGSFYATHRMRHAELKDTFATEIESYAAELDRIRDALQSRRDDVFSTRRLGALVGNKDTPFAAIDQLNDLIEANNAKTKSLATDQASARTDLRLNEVAQFAHDIDLVAEEARIAALQCVAEDAEQEVESLASEVAALEAEAERLETELKDERKGAQRVNEYLSHYFGHDGLRLKAVEEEDGSAYKFEVRRGDKPAHNLSEGECSLVAFCYFVAKLRASDSDGKSLVIYIDDPVSSLDTNHIFFIFSLIESEIARPSERAGAARLGYQQLFISTHNLDFLKYLKRLSQPKKSEGGIQYFLLEQRDGLSKLSAMPRHLRDYHTEFNYLFGQVFRCRDPENARSDYDAFYNFGNNLRKFLEVYLFYRYPFRDDQEAKDERLRRFFRGDETSTALARLLTNDLSHLDEAFDRGTRPLEIPEVSALATHVLDTLWEHDAAQFNALLESVGEPPRQPVVSPEQS